VRFLFAHGNSVPKQGVNIRWEREVFWRQPQQMEFKLFG
jgi:hypothetical protein